MNKNCSTNDYGNSQHRPCCESKVINSTTLGECENWCKEPYGTCGPIVAKVPVVLADCKIQIDVEAKIHLDEPAFDIKTIDKKVCITQCHVVPYTNKLFLEGYVQKNIQYSTVECANKSSISGSILHTTLNVPFKCVTAICYDKWPILGKSFKAKSNVLDKSMLCTDDKEDNWTHFEKPFEPIFCELEWSKILEADIYDRNIKGYTEPFSKENLFQDFTEKMVVYVGIKVLQKRSVYIPEPLCLEDIKKDMDKKEEKEDYGYGKNIEVGYVEGKGVVGRIMEEE